MWILQYLGCTSRLICQHYLLKTELRSPFQTGPVIWFSFLREIKKLLMEVWRLSNHKGKERINIHVIAFVICGAEFRRLNYLHYKQMRTSNRKQRL